MQVHIVTNDILTRITTKQRTTHNNVETQRGRSQCGLVNLYVHSEFTQICPGKNISKYNSPPETQALLRLETTALITMLI